MRIITAREGYIYRRLHDGFEMGKTIHLGIDYSTGEPREDKEEYYEEVKDEREILKMNQYGKNKGIQDNSK